MTTYPNRYYYLGPWQLKTNDMGTYWDAPNHTVGRIDLRPVVQTEAYGFFSTDTPLSNSDYIYFGDNLAGNVTGLQIDAWKTSLGMASVDGTTLFDVLWDTLTAHADPEGSIHAYPIMPTYLGVQELHLGGHSLIKSRQFQGEKDKSWKVVQKVLQDTFVRLDRLKKDKKCVDSLPAKVLGAWKQKYKISDENLFIPLGTDKIKAKRPTTSVSDNFNRSDESLDAGNWVETDGGFSVKNNAVYGPETGATAFPAAARYTTALSSDDQEVTATPKDAGKEYGLGGPVARFDSSGKNFYGALARDEGTRELLKVVSGTKSSLRLDTNGAFGQVIKLVCDGSSISLYSNGSLVFGPVTDTSITGNLYAGVLAHSNKYFPVYVDDFLAEDLVSTVLPIKQIYNYNLKMRS